MEDYRQEDDDFETWCRSNGIVNHHHPEPGSGDLGLELLLTASLIAGAGLAYAMRSQIYDYVVSLFK